MSQVDSFSLDGLPKTQLVLLLLDQLNQLGYSDTVKSLEQESLVQFEHSQWRAFREAFINGLWDASEVALLQLGIHYEENLRKIKFLIRRQKYLELLERKEVESALSVLRNELAPLEGKAGLLGTNSENSRYDQGELKRLATCLVFVRGGTEGDASPNDRLRSFSSWAGSGPLARSQELEHIISYMPKHLSIVPQGRLTQLIHQAVSFQEDHCQFIQSLPLSSMPGIFPTSAATPTSSSKQQLSSLYPSNRGLRWHAAEQSLYHHPSLSTHNLPTRPLIHHGKSINLFENHRCEVSRMEWRVESVSRHLGSEIHVLAFSPCGSLIASGASNGVIHIHSISWQPNQDKRASEPSTLAHPTFSSQQTSSIDAKSSTVGDAGNGFNSPSSSYTPTEGSEYVLTRMVSFELPPHITKSIIASKRGVVSLDWLELDLSIDLDTRSRDKECENGISTSKERSKGFYGSSSVSSSTSAPPSGRKRSRSEMHFAEDDEPFNGNGAPGTRDELEQTQETSHSSSDNGYSDHTYNSGSKDGLHDGEREERPHHHSGEEGLADSSLRSHRPLSASEQDRLASSTYSRPYLLLVGFLGGVGVLDVRSKGWISWIPSSLPTTSAHPQFSSSSSSSSSSAPSSPRKESLSVFKRLLDNSHSDSNISTASATLSASSSSSMLSDKSNTSSNGAQHGHSETIAPISSAKWIPFISPFDEGLTHHKQSRRHHQHHYQQQQQQSRHQQGPVFSHQSAMGSLPSSFESTGQTRSSSSATPPQPTSPWQVFFIYAGLDGKMRLVNLAASLIHFAFHYALIPDSLAHSHSSNGIVHHQDDGSLDGASRESNTMEGIEPTKPSSIGPTSTSTLSSSGFSAALSHFSSNSANTSKNRQDRPRGQDSFGSSHQASPIQNLTCTYMPRWTRRSLERLGVDFGEHEIKNDSDLPPTITLASIDLTQCPISSPIIKSWTFAPINDLCLTKTGMAITVDQAKRISFTDIFGWIFRRFHAPWTSHPIINASENMDRNDGREQPHSNSHLRSSSSSSSKQTSTPHVASTTLSSSSAFTSAGSLPAQSSMGATVATTTTTSSSSSTRFHSSTAAHHTSTPTATGNLGPRAPHLPASGFSIDVGGLNLTSCSLGLTDDSLLIVTSMRVGAPFKGLHAEQTILIYDLKTWKEVVRLPGLKQSRFIVRASLAPPPPPPTTSRRDILTGAYGSNSSAEESWFLASGSEDALVHLWDVQDVLAPTLEQRRGGFSHLLHTTATMRPSIHQVKENQRGGAGGAQASPSSPPLNPSRGANQGGQRGSSSSRGGVHNLPPHHHHHGNLHALHPNPLQPHNPRLHPLHSMTHPQLFPTTASLQPLQQHPMPPSSTPFTPAASPSVPSPFTLPSSHSSVINDVAWHPSIPYCLASVSDDQSVRLWRLKPQE